jgi:hypothetical protein
VDFAAVRTLLSIRDPPVARALVAEGFDSRADDFATVRDLLSIRGVLAVRALGDVFVAAFLCAAAFLFAAALLLAAALPFGAAFLAFTRFEAAPLAGTTPRPWNTPGFGVAATGGRP